MRHRNHSQRLSQKPALAQSMMRSMLTSILLYERVRTTKKRAQVLRPLVDKVITIGKRERTDLAIRRINQLVTHDNACRKVLEVMKQRYAKRPSGFTRMVPVGMRKGDGAKLVDVILIDAVLPGEAPAKEEPAKKTPSKKSSK